MLVLKAPPAPEPPISGFLHRAGSHLGYCMQEKLSAEALLGLKVLWYFIWRYFAQRYFFSRSGRPPKARLEKGDRLPQELGRWLRPASSESLYCTWKDLSLHCQQGTYLKAHSCISDISRYGAVWRSVPGGLSEASV